MATGAGLFQLREVHSGHQGASKAAGIPPFTPRRVQHSVATWAIKKGADPASVAAFLNHKHKSPTTAQRFYATHAVPTKVPTLR